MTAPTAGSAVAIPVPVLAVATGGEKRIIILAMTTYPDAHSAVTNLNRVKKRGTATPVRGVESTFRVQTLPLRDSSDNSIVRGSALEREVTGDDRAVLSRY